MKIKESEVYTRNREATQQRRKFTIAPPPHRHVGKPQQPSIILSPVLKLTAQQLTPAKPRSFTPYAPQLQPQTSEASSINYIDVAKGTGQGIAAFGGSRLGMTLGASALSVFGPVGTMVGAYAGGIAGGVAASFITGEIVDTYAYFALGDKSRESVITELYDGGDAWKAFTDEAKTSLQYGLGAGLGLGLSSSVAGLTGAMAGAAANSATHSAFQLNDLNQTFAQDGWTQQESEYFRNSVIAAGVDTVASVASVGIGSTYGGGSNLLTNQLYNFGADALTNAASMAVSAELLDQKYTVKDFYASLAISAVAGSVSNQMLKRAGVDKNYTHIKSVAQETGIHDVATAKTYLRENFGIHVDDEQPIGIKTRQHSNAHFVETVQAMVEPLHAIDDQYPGALDGLTFSSRRPTSSGAGQADERTGHVWMNHFADLGTNIQTYNIMLTHEFAGHAMVSKARPEAIALRFRGADVSYTAIDIQGSLKGSNLYPQMLEHFQQLNPDMTRQELMTQIKNNMHFEFTPTGKNTTRMDIWYDPARMAGTADYDPLTNFSGKYVPTHSDRGRGDGYGATLLAEAHAVLAANMIPDGWDAKARGTQLPPDIERNFKAFMRAAQRNPVGGR